MEGSVLKSERLLQIYSKLVEGNILRKKDLSWQFNVTERSIQSDIESLRCFLIEKGIKQDIVYDCKLKGYKLENQPYNMLNNSEILDVCKILLESRSMRVDEMIPILDKLVDCCVPEQSKQIVLELLANEKHHYIEPHHRRCILNGLWEIAQAVQNHQYIEINYRRLKEPNIVKRIVKPVGIMFSEYYFYLTAFLEDKNVFDEEDDIFPTIYRIDRIESFKVLDKHFAIPYKKRFQEGEFRKRVQFMYGGKLRRIKFKYTGLSIESVLDRLLTAEAVEDNEGGWIVSAEVFGDGVDMWLRSQGESICVI